MRLLLKYIAACIVIAGISGVSTHASFNQFTFTSFEADYYLIKDDSGRSQLRTVERLTADFPQDSTNRGIERALPKQYDGHDTNLSIESVEDQAGSAIEYTTRTSNNNAVLRIGNPNEYARGVKTYVITYTQRDVTKNFGDRDEFYWDTNGTEGTRPFGAVIARVHLGGEIANALNGDQACYRGKAGSTERCQITRQGSVITIAEKNFAPGENATLAVGFRAETFSPYTSSIWERIGQIWLGVTIASIVPFIGVMIWLGYRYYKQNNRDGDIGTVPVEYLPPQYSVLVSERIGESTRSGLTAVILDLAVRHYIKLYQVREKTIWKSAEYDIEIVKDIVTLSEEEQLFVRTLFGDNAKVGDRFEMKKLKNDYKMAAKLRKNAKLLDTTIREGYGLRAKNEDQSRWFRKTGWVLFVVSIILLSPIGVVAAIIAFVSGASLRPLTDEGVALRRHLRGLKQYILVAEKDRLAFLQSPNGAEKSIIPAENATKKLVKLYERVLPYAVWFGLEKEWNKQLGAYYEQDGGEPSWYNGTTAFSAAAFASTMSDFSATTNTYSASTSSSSSGSGGGGSSGGGGGGGGSGGW
jgi:uncharacterized membrane protein YgcG